MGNVYGFFGCGAAEQVNVVGHDDISANNPVAGIPPRGFEDFMHGVVGEYFLPLMGADGKKNDWGSVDLFDGRVVRRVFAILDWRDDVLIVHELRGGGH